MNYLEVNFVGFVCDIEEYIELSSLYVHLGRGDTFLVSVLEALLGGMPCIVSEYTGSREVIKELREDFVVPIDVYKTAEKNHKVKEIERRFKREIMLEDFSNKWNALLKKMKNNKNYIIIVHYKGLRDTFTLLENLLNLDYQDFQVILVNNNPEENLAKSLKNFITYKNWNLISEKIENNEFSFQIKEFKYPIILLNQEKNLGYAGGVNAGIKYALKSNDFSYLWILNNDLILAPDSLGELINFAERLKKEGKKVGIIGSKLFYYHSPQILQGVGGKYNKYFALTKHIGGFEEDKEQYDKDDIKIDYVVGVSMFVSREFIEDVGLMDERYFLYFEDLDWSERAKRKGYELKYCWKSKVYHKEGGSIGSSSKGEKKSKLADYYGIRNRIIFTKKFYPQYQWSVYLSLLGVILNRIKRKQFDRIKLVFDAIKDGIKASKNL